MEMQKNLPEKSKFNISELMLCYEPDPAKARVLYDAKVLDVGITKDDKSRKVLEYYVHFQGWNKSWDRWVLEDQILKDNESSRELQEKLLKEAIKPHKKQKTKSSKNELLDDKDDKSVASMGSLTSVDNEEDGTIIQIPLVSLDIPKILATHLEDDCYNIKRKKKLIHLPRKPSVNDIFNDYYSYCEGLISTPEGKGISLNIIQELVTGLNTYFNFTLATLLLYNFEREQYFSFFLVKKVKEHLSSISKTFSPPLSPLSNKLLAPRLPGVCDSKESSPSHSRASSFCDEPCFLKRVFPSERKSKRELANDSVIQSTVSKLRRKTRSALDETPSVFSFSTENKPIDNQILSEEVSPTSSVSSRKSSRERRLSRFCFTPKDIKLEEHMLSKDYSNVCLKEEQHSKVHKNNKTEDAEDDNTPRLRRSTRTHKLIDITDDLLPIGSTAKSLHESNKFILKPLQIKTDDQVKSAEILDEKSFIVFPQQPNGDAPADIYGAEHLLRLFVKLPVLLASSTMEQNKMQLILDNANDFLKYLVKRVDLFSESVYSESVL